MASMGSTKIIGYLKNYIRKGTMISNSGIIPSPLAPLPPEEGDLFFKEGAYGPLLDAP
jgi:hypothetical protein